MPIGDAPIGDIPIAGQPGSALTINPNPLSIHAGQTGTFTLSVLTAFPSDSTISLVAADPTILRVPLTVGLPAGSLSTIFRVDGLKRGTTTVTATFTVFTGNATANVGPRITSHKVEGTVDPFRLRAPTRPLLQAYLRKTASRRAH